MFDTQPGNAPFRLRRNGFIRLAGAAGTAIRCRSGLLWITAERDGTDYVLRAGESMAVRSSGRVVIEAGCDSELQLLPARGGAIESSAVNLLSEPAL